MTQKKSSHLHIRFLPLPVLEGLRNIRRRPMTFAKLTTVLSFTAALAAATPVLAATNTNVDDSHGVNSIGIDIRGAGGSPQVDPGVPVEAVAGDGAWRCCRMSECRQQSQHLPAGRSVVLRRREPDRRLSAAVRAGLCGSCKGAAVRSVDEQGSGSASGHQLDRRLAGRFGTGVLVHAYRGKLRAGR